GSGVAAGDQLRQRRGGAVRRGQPGQPVGPDRGLPAGPLVQRRCAGLATAVSADGGSTWKEPAAPHFSTCAGGTAANGGAYDRSSDPWVSIGPDGRAYQVSLSVNAAQTISAILASTSTDGGLTWGEPVTIQRDNSPDHFVFNDKESVTADPS